MVTVKGHSQQESTKQKKISQKKISARNPKSNEQLNRRSQRLQQLTEVSTRSLRSREIQVRLKQLNRVCHQPKKEHCSNTQSKSNKAKTNQKHVKEKVLEIKPDSKEEEMKTNEVYQFPQRKKRKWSIRRYTSSSQCIKGSGKVSAECQKRRNKIYFWDKKIQSGCFSGPKKNEDKEVGSRTSEY